MESRRGKVLALVLAGGAGGRLGVLTDHRPKPAMPFAGVYRLVDFPLSNCHHSRISDVWVLQQYRPGPLSEHLANGRPWDLDRTYGGLRVVHPSRGSDEEGWYEGNADALFRNRGEIAAFDPTTVLVLSADHVYALDYREVLAEHERREAAATVVTTRVAFEEAGRFGTVEADRDGRITSFAYKPDEPKTDVVTAEVFAYSTARLLELLEELADGEDESGLDDFGDRLLPRLVEDGAAYEYRLDGYWRDVGTVESYWDAHRDLLAEEPPIDLDDSAWPILTRSHQRPPAYVAEGRIERSLVSPGATVRGEVSGSVLGPGARVGEGAVVRDSVVLDDTVVEDGARVVRAVVDGRAVVASGTHVGGAGGDITVVGYGARVRERVESGAEVAPADPS